jgi:hypothetical protein
MTLSTSSSPDPRRSGIILSFSLVGFFLLAGYLAIWHMQSPAPQPATSRAQDFSAERALAHCQATAREPHPMGSPANDAVRAYLVQTLARLGVETVVQVDRQVSGHDAVEVNNVLGRIPGTANTKAVVLMAHYDSVPYGPGAADDGSGVATLLETARAVRAGPPLKNDLLLVFTDGEESGLLGARAFLRHAWANGAGLIMNFDVRGTSGPSLLFETSVGNGRLMAEVAKAGVPVRASSLMYDVYRRMPFNSDFTPAKQHGLKGFNFAFIDGFAWYHTGNDTPAHLSLASLQHQGACALGLARHFGHLPLDADLTAPDAVYFNLAGSSLVRYPASWSGWVTLAAGVLFGVMLVLGLGRRHLRIAGLIWGALALLAVAVLTMLTTFAALSLVYGPKKLLIQYTTNVTHLPDLIAVHHNTLYGWALAGLAVATVLSCYQWLGRRLSEADLASGALLWWGVVAVAVQRVAPGGSYLAAWPLGFASLGLGLSFLWPVGSPPSLLRTVVLGLSALPGIWLVVPAYHVSLLALLVMCTPLLVLLLVLIQGLLIPHLPIVSQPNRWWLPAGAGSLAVLLLAVGKVQSSYTSERPKLNCLAYGLNLDEGKAYWMSRDPQLDDWTSQFFATQGTMPARGTVSEFIPDDLREYWKAPAPLAAYQGPQLRLIEDTITPEGRSATVGLTAPDHPSELSLQAMSGTVVRAATVYGQPVRGNGTNWRLRFRGLPPEGATITFDLPSDTPLVLRVGTRQVGLPELPGIARRPAHMAAEPNTIRRNGPVRSDTTYTVRTFSLGPGADRDDQAVSP